MTDSPNLIPWPDDRMGMIDSRRSADLGNGFLAAVMVGPDGAEHLLLASREAMGRRELCDNACTDVRHEQDGALPAEFMRRLAS
jgi:hypothetical protein